MAGGHLEVVTGLDLVAGVYIRGCAGRLVDETVAQLVVDGLADGGGVVIEGVPAHAAIRLVETEDTVETVDVRVEDTEADTTTTDLHVLQKGLLHVVDVDAVTGCVRTGEVEVEAAHLV